MPNRWCNALARIHVISLGCPKNLIDTEHMLGSLLASGHVLSSEPAESDIILINTCGFIEDAKKEAIAELLKAAEIKSDKPHIKIVACGCLVQRYHSELENEIPEIDGFVGVFDTDKICEVVSDVVSGEHSAYVGEKAAEEVVLRPRLITTPAYTAYLKISEGCDNRCAYCAIPLIRGPMQSRAFEKILEEACALVGMGVKELVIVAQDPTQYGLDIKGKYLLPSLFDRLQEIEGLEWIRLMYAHPDRADVVVDAVSAGSKVCAYVDLPVQHASKDVLRRMGRNGDARRYLQAIEALRRIRSQIAIRTTFMVGFPGETDEDFDILLDFAQKARFDYAGAFRFSREEGTRAAVMPEQVGRSIAHKRLERLLDAQQRISLERHASRAGNKMRFLVTGKTARAYFGRLETQAPDVDGGAVLTHTDMDLTAGQIVDCVVIGFKNGNFRLNPTQPS